MEEQLAKNTTKTFHNFCQASQVELSPKSKIKHMRNSTRLQTPGGRSFNLDRNYPVQEKDVLNYCSAAPTTMLKKRNPKQERELLAKMSAKTAELRRAVQRDIEPRISLHDPMPSLKKKDSEQGGKNNSRSAEKLHNPLKENNDALRNLINSCYHAKLYEDPEEHKKKTNGALNFEEPPTDKKRKIKNMFDPFKKKF